MASTTPSPAAPGLPGALALAAKVSQALPADSPATWRRAAYRSVLASVLPGAVQGEGHEDADILSQYVREAAAAASTASPEHRDDAFELVLGALLDDWAEEWDMSDDEDMDG